MTIRNLARAARGLVETLVEYDEFRKRAPEMKAAYAGSTTTTTNVGLARRRATNRRSSATRGARRTSTGIAGGPTRRRWTATSRSESAPPARLLRLRGPSVASSPNIEAGGLRVPRGLGGVPAEPPDGVHHRDSGLWRPKRPRVARDPTPPLGDPDSWRA